MATGPDTGKWTGLYASGKIVSLSELPGRQHALGDSKEERTEVKKNNHLYVENILSIRAANEKAGVHVLSAHNILEGE